MRPTCPRCRRKMPKYDGPHVCKTRKPIPRGTRPIARSAPAPRGKRPPRVNRERRAKEWPRQYGCAHRVAWVNSLPCTFCGRTPSQNAHTRTGGGSRKANAATIIPACGRDEGQLEGCHQKFDRAKRSFPAAHGIDVAVEARAVDVHWRRIRTCTCEDES